MNHVELHVEVTADAAHCLDLVLEHTGVSYRDLTVAPCGASVVVEATDTCTAPRIAEALRSRLGCQLITCTNGTRGASKDNASSKYRAASSSLHTRRR